MKKITLKPEQLPTNFTEIRGEKVVEFNDNDNQIILWCQPKGGEFVVRFAEFYDWNEETEEWDIEEKLTPKEGVERFSHSHVLNPFSKELAKLVC